jgi:tetratricopeptide (TPR) repeat protein
MSIRILVCLFVLVLPFGMRTASAQLEPPLKEPYLWRVVLKIQHHPLLSGSFREQLKRDLEAALQPAIDKLGTVEVIDLADLPRDRWDPLWQQFEDKGFTALDAPRDLTGVKTHFLQIQYRDGHYLLESRQYDGFTGLASGYAGVGSPVIRKQSVRAPEMVGRAAGLMLDRDFGLTGNAEPVTGRPDEARILVRGGQLGPVDGLVKPGDVFAVAQVSHSKRPAPPPARTATGKVIAPPPGSIPPPGLTSKLRPFTLLKVTEVGRDGVIRCVALSRYKVALPAIAGNVAGYRCMKLGTIDAPVAIRLVGGDGSSQKQAGLVTVRATEKGFNGPADASDILVLRDGVFRSGRPLASVACVTVSISPTQSMVFPVPVFTSDPINLPFNIDPRAEERAAFERDALATAARVADARNAQTICFDATARLIDKQKNSDALARARGGFKAAKEAEQGIADDLVRLREQADKSPEGARLVKAIEQHLEALRQYNTQLNVSIETLEKVVARENDPTAAAREVQAQAVDYRINILLGRGEVEEALNAYDQLATLLPDDPKVKENRDKLKAAWVPKNEAHARARTYLLKTWPGISSIPDFKESLPLLESSIDECIKNGDRFTLLKLQNVIISAALVKFNELFGALDPNADGDRKLLMEAKDVGGKLPTLELEIKEFLEKKAQ